MVVRLGDALLKCLPRRCAGGLGIAVVDAECAVWLMLVLLVLRLSVSVNPRFGFQMYHFPGLCLTPAVILKSLALCGLLNFILSLYLGVVDRMIDSCREPNSSRLWRTKRWRFLAVASAFLLRSSCCFKNTLLS